MTYEIGEMVVYPSLGICEVTDNAAHVDLLGKPEETYYVLSPLIERLGKAYVPVSREDTIRPILSREEALLVLEQIPSIEVDDFQDTNSRLVEDHFRQILKQNDCLQALMVAKTMQHRIAQQKNRQRGGSSSTYKRLLDEAERRAYGELSVALGVSRESIAAKVMESCLEG
jgi:CarD family transcriptional regulator